MRFRRSLNQNSTVSPLRSMARYKSGNWRSNSSRVMLSEVYAFWIGLHRNLPSHAAFPEEFSLAIHGKAVLDLLNRRRQS